MAANARGRKQACGAGGDGTRATCARNRGGAPAAAADPEAKSCKENGENFAAEQTRRVPERRTTSKSQEKSSSVEYDRGVAQCTATTTPRQSPGFGQPGHDRECKGQDYRCRHEAAPIAGVGTGSLGGDAALDGLATPMS